jgi:hypothetical protein
MPVDPAGTSPGLSPTKEEPKKLNAKCRSGNCDSIQVYDVSVDGVPGKRYQCVKCKHTWAVNPGGSFNVF